MRWKKVYAKRFHVLDSSSNSNSLLLHNDLVFFSLRPKTSSLKYGSKQLFVYNCQTWKSILLWRFVPNQNRDCVHLCLHENSQYLIVKSLYSVFFLEPLIFETQTEKKTQDHAQYAKFHFFIKWNRMWSIFDATIFVF